jgi:hypothetical protein
MFKLILGLGFVLFLVAIAFSQQFRCQDAMANFDFAKAEEAIRDSTLTKQVQEHSFAL